MPRALIVEIFGDASHFAKSMDKAAGKTKQFSKAAGVAGLAIGGVFALGVEKAIKGAMEDEKANARLAQSFKNVHVPLEGFSKRITDAEKAGTKLGFMDEDVADSLGSLVTATHNGTKALKLESVAMDVARFTHKNLGAATKTLTMAMAGSQRATKQLGLTVSKVTTEQDKAKAAYNAQTDAIKAHYASLGKLTDAQKKEEQAALDAAKVHYDGERAIAKVNDTTATSAKVIAKVRDSLHGQLKAFAETTEGKMEAYRAKMDQVKDSIGKGLIPVLGALVGALSSAAGFFQEHTTLAKVLFAGIGVLSGALLVLSAATWAVNTAMAANPIGLVVIAIALLVVGIVELVKHWDDVTAAMGKVWDYIKGTFIGVWEDLKNAIKAVKDWIVAHWPEIATLLSGPFALILAPATNAFGVRDKLIDAFTAVKNWIVDRMNDVVTFFTDIGTRIWDAFKSGWDAVKGNITGAFDSIKDHVGTVIVDVVKAFTALPGKIGGAISGAMGELWSVMKKIFDPKEWAKKILGFLGFGSPSPFFVDIGKQIIHSIAHGVGQFAGIVEDAVKSIAGGIGGTQGGGASGKGGTGVGKSGGLTLPLLLSWAGQEGIGVTSTTGGTHVKGSYHYQGRAIDVAGSASAMAHFFLDTIKHFGVSRITELFYDPMGYYIDNGRAVKGAIGGHSDHVHLALGSGGIVTRPTMALIGERGPEAVIPLSRTNLGSGKNNRPTHIHVEVGGKELFSLLQQEDGRYIKRNGRSAFGT